MISIGLIQCIVTDGTALAESHALLCFAIEIALTMLVSLFTTLETKLKFNGSKERRLQRHSTCNSPELTHINTIHYKIQIFYMLLEDASWSALLHSCLLPCLYHNIWIFGRFKRETFVFPLLVCWCLSFVIKIWTACASCWSTESHHRIPKAFIGLSRCVGDH